MSPLTVKFARLGSCGKFPNNIERDLGNLLQVPVHPLWVELPIRDPASRNKIITEKFPIMLPHEIYHWLHDTCSCLSDFQLFVLLVSPEPTTRPWFSSIDPIFIYANLPLYCFLLLPTFPYCFLLLPTFPYCFLMLPTYQPSLSVSYLQHPRKVARCQSRRRTLLATGPTPMCLSTLEHR